MKKLLLFIPLCFFAFLLSAQRDLTMAEAIMKGRTTLAPAMLKQLQWIPGTGQFTHVVGNKMVRVNAPDLKTDTLDFFANLNTALGPLGAKSLDALPAWHWIDSDNAWFQTEKAAFTYTLKANNLQQKNTFPAEAEVPDLHEKTLNAAYRLKDELRVSVAGKEMTVAKSEEDGIEYGKSVHREEFGIYKGTFWSPSGRSLAFYRMDERMVTKYPIYELDSMPAQVRYIRYPYAGSTSHHVTLGVFDTQTGKTIYLQTGEPAEQYLTNIAWSPDDKYILIAVVNREQDHMWLKQFDAATGAFVKTLFEETDDKWVEPEHPAEFVPGRNDQFVWWSERSGFNQLYLYDLTGKLLRPLSEGKMPVTANYGFSKNGEKIFYQMADESGLNRYLYTADLKSGKAVRLNDDMGMHGAVVSNTGDWVLDIYSNATTPRNIFVQSVGKPANRKIAFSAPNPLADYRPGQTRMLTLTSKGGMPLNARMILPPNFDENKKYPAIVYVYNGPHVQMVANTWLGAGELWMHRMAEEGYIIFSLDGRGSANRGFAFENAIHRQCGTVEVEDQLTGALYLKSQKFVDSTRLGVYGWSYGGFMATSLMTRPEAKGVFKCGIAGGPVMDWRMYEIMYTERYMDTPKENPAGYDNATPFKYIDNLEGRLLIIHGSADDVVLWQNSLRYIRECVRRGKQVEYFVYPDHLHNVLGKDRVHLFEKVEKFFKDNLPVEERP